MRSRLRCRRRPGLRGPTACELVRQVGAVLTDLPLFLTAPLYRRRHLRWGAEPHEVAAGLPGDGLCPDASFLATRAITIAATPEQVWPWLVQVGAGRGGWYSDDLLDNLARPSATEVLADLQHVKVGEWVPMSPWGTPTERTAFRVEAFDAPHWLVWTKPDSSWVWRLTRLPGGGTRLLTRVRAHYDWSRPLTALFGVVLLELGDFAMQRRMLRGIKARAEHLAAG